MPYPANPECEASLPTQARDGDFEGLPPRAAPHQAVNVAPTEWHEDADVITIAFKD